MFSFLIIVSVSNLLAVLKNSFHVSGCFLLTSLSTLAVKFASNKAECAPSELKPFTLLKEANLNTGLFFSFISVSRTF